ncbi:MAG: DUF6316 family protein [Gammaproteobacteria bacterium]
METYRQGESGSIPFRTGRFFCVDAAWYFACREGLDHGPYYSKPEAETALRDFLQNLDTIAETAKSALAS